MRNDAVRMLYHLLFSGQEVHSLARTSAPVHMSPSSESHPVARLNDSTNSILSRSSVFPLPAVQHVIMRGAFVVGLWSLSPHMRSIIRSRELG